MRAPEANARPGNNDGISLPTAGNGHLAARRTEAVKPPMCRARAGDQHVGMAIDPDLTRFHDEDPGGPVVMLNLLRLADDGRGLYAEYGRHLRETLLPRYGIWTPQSMRRGRLRA
jgi:hypothetical protein